jgi:hypothetical protein
LSFKLDELEGIDALNWNIAALELTFSVQAEKGGEGKGKGKGQKEY